MTRILAALLVVGISLAGFEAFRFLSSGPGDSSEQVVLDVTNGQTLHQIAVDMESKGLIRDAFRFRVLAKITGLGSSVKRGEYALNKGMTPQGILGVLVSGKSIQYPVTFPEGSNIYEMAQILEEKKIFKAQDFLAACRDKALASKMVGMEVSSLEGYLFPETYNVTKFTSLDDLLNMMVQNFKTTMATLESQGRTAPLSLSRHELVTLASVVEKETGAHNERPLIASVFYNRLQKNIRLQSDPTILYGIWIETGAYKENITKEDILKPTAYNTYTVSKLHLAPSPILDASHWRQ